MTTKFGLSAALTTPFDSEGRIVHSVMTTHALRRLGDGCDSVTLFGTTGEGSSIANRERTETLAAFLKAGVPAEKIVLGVMADSAEDAADQAREGLDAGARNILLAPPSYFKNVSDEGLFGWFAAVFNRLGAAGRDVLVYNIPSVTMVKLSVELVGRLRQAFPRMVTGVKDSGGDWAHTERLLKEHGDLVILIGDERHLAQGTRLGGQGAISGMANVLPQEVRAMAVDGRDNPPMVAMVEEILKFPVTPAVKVLVARTSGDAIWLNTRPPLVTIPVEGRNRIGEVFDATFSKGAAA